MLLKIFKNRTVSSSGTWGTKNENNYEILNFEFPEELEEYNKRIVYYLGNQKVWDPIIDNKAILTNAITTKGSVKAYIWCTKTDAQYETDVDFRTQIFVMNFYENDNADGIVPTPEQVDGFNTMLTAMNNKIAEVNALEQTIETAESTRQTNEQTRQTNEATRQSNEQTRQKQEAERERRTDEAIGNIEDKTAEYNANAEAKTNEFNDLVNVQKLSIENYGETQLNAIGRKGQQALGSITTTTQFALQNISLAQQTGVSAVETASSEAITNFNTNATNKTNAFNSNATEKTTAFDNNASTKTSEFNTNAESKTTSFNDNATQKTTNFDNNASEKTTAYNENAQEKIDEYDEHIVEYQAQIDELQEEVEELSENMPWSTTEQSTEISVDDAAKYSKNKLELFGNTEQIQYTGVQLLDMLDAVNGYFINDSGDTNTSIGGFHTQDYIDVGNNTSIYGRFEALNNIRIGRFYIQEYNENKESTQRHSIGIYDSVFTLGQVKKWHINLSEGTKYIRLSNYGLQKLEEESYVGQYPTKDNWNDLVKSTISFSDVDIYEPYVGGVPSPSPDYPQDIHVVTGNNSVGVQGKNLFDQNVERKNAFSTGDIGQVVGYGNSSASYSYVNCAKVEANKTYTLSWKIDGTKGATSNRNSKIVDSNNIVLEEFATWINNTTHITFTPQNTGYLVLTTDVSSVDIQIEQGSTATSYVPYYHADYPINLGSLELCKIGNYQDYLYKENGNWYKYGAIDKYIFSGTETYYLLERTGVNVLQQRSVINNKVNKTRSMINIIASHFVGIKDNDGNIPETIRVDGSGQVDFTITNTNPISVSTEAFKTWLNTHNVTSYYLLATPTSTQITDETLISQLDAIYEHLKLVKGTNHITITPSDLEPYVTLNYMQDLPSKLDNLDSRLALLE